MTLGLLRVDSSNRIEALDAIRGIAALAIVALHGVYIFPLGSDIPSGMVILPKIHRL
jgi:peptidoglycan/LPS O-acetylase OafA/YrhL